MRASPRISVQQQQRKYRFGQALHIDRRNDGSEDLLILCLKPNLLCVAGHDPLKDVILRTSSSDTGFF